MAGALNVTPVNARNQLFQYQLRWIDEAEADAAVLRTLVTSRFSVDEKQLAFGIESPLSRATIDSRLKAAGVCADISLSGDTLRVSLDQLDVFITTLIGTDRAADLERHLKKEGHLKGGTLYGWLKKYGGAAAGGAAGAAGKEMFTHVFGGISGWLDGSGVDTLGDLITGAGEE